MFYNHLRLSYDGTQKNHYSIKNTVLKIIMVLVISSVAISSGAENLPNNTSILNNDTSYLNKSYDNIPSEYLPLLAKAEQESNKAARNVLRQARYMTLDNREIVIGACWDYLNLVFQRAGTKRDTIFSNLSKKPPYADINDIKAGDWLYYLNHSYNDIEHSGMFIGWTDKENKQALILSYAGEKRKEPARYRVYDLSSVYNIMRPIYKN